MDQEPNTTPNPTPTSYTPPAGVPQPAPQQPSQPPFGAPTPPSQPQFQPQPPQSNGKKKLFMILGVVVVLVIIGALLFVTLGKKKDDTSSNKSTGSSAGTNSNSGSNTSAGSNATADKFTKYDVKDVSGIKYSVLFYKDAKPLAKNSLTYLVAGDTGAQSSVYLAPGTGATSNQADCASAGLTPTTMKINGQSTVVCYAAGNIVYMGFTSVNGVVMRVNVAAQKGISMEDAKTILESITFK